MRYTREQYNAIIADVEQAIKDAEKTRVNPNDPGEYVPFRCIETRCAFCPFTYGNHECSDIASYRDIGIFDTERTADEWREWLERFQLENSPDRPYTVEIPTSFVDVIDEACHIDSSVSYPVFALLRLIQKQINEQNRD